ncbi:MAG: hypothetical protein WCX48_10345 [Bacteroidales bacterium]
MTENKIFIKKNLAISEQISDILEQKGWSQKVFAQKMGKEPSEISKLMLGASVMGIIYSTARGIILEKTHNSYLNGVILPVIDPGILLNNNLSKEINN